MAATVLIEEWTGTTATPAQTDKTSGTVRFKNAANATVDNNNRLVVPTSLREYSFEKWLRLTVTVAPDVDIDNLRAYPDAGNSFGTGIKVWYAVDGAFTTPAEPANTNDPPQHDATPMTDLWAASSGTPIDMDAINTGPFTGTGDIGDFLVLVMEVETNAANGALTAETLTFAFDET